MHLTSTDTWTSTYPEGMFELSEEHVALRAAVRDLVTDKIAPYAAAVDEEARFPQEAYDALLAADLHAVHVPEQYGGNGADALATCLVIEELAQGCATTAMVYTMHMSTVPMIAALAQDGQID